MVDLLQGPGFSVEIPEGFECSRADPATQTYRYWPPGARGITALIFLKRFDVDRSKHWFESIYQGKTFPYGDDLYDIGFWIHDFGTEFNIDMGAYVDKKPHYYKEVLDVGSTRRITISGYEAYVRDIDILSFGGTVYRLSCVFVSEHRTSVGVVIHIVLENWPDYIGSCLQFLAGLRLKARPLSGSTPSSDLLPAQVQAVIDPTHPDRLEYRLRNSDRSESVITSLPTSSYEGRPIININYYVDMSDNSIKVRDINGTDIVVGHHNIS